MKKNKKNYIIILCINRLFALINIHFIITEIYNYFDNSIYNTFIL